MPEKNPLPRQLLIGGVILLAVVVAGAAALITRVQSLSRQQVFAVSAEGHADDPAAGGNFAIGDEIPDLTFERLGGGGVELSALLDGDHFVAINFHHPDCPCAQSCGRLIADLLEDSPGDLHVVGVLTGGHDDPRVLRAIEEQNRDGVVTFPIYTDEDGSLRELFGAERTPEVWLLDRDGRLAYHGAPESTLFPGTADHRYLLREAVEALRGGGEPEVTHYMAIGCPID